MIAATLGRAKLPQGSMWILSYPNFFSDDLRHCLQQKQSWLPLFSHPAVDLDKQIPKVTLAPQVNAEKIRRLAGMCRHCGSEPPQRRLTEPEHLRFRSTALVPQKGPPNTSANWGEFFVVNIFQSVWSQNFRDEIFAQIFAQIFAPSFAQTFTQEQLCNQYLGLPPACRTLLWISFLQPCAVSVIGQHWGRLVSAAALMSTAAPFYTNSLPQTSRTFLIFSVRPPKIKISPLFSFCGKLGNGRNTVSRVLFRRRELTEFWGKLGEFCEKLGEFALAHK